MAQLPEECGDIPLGPGKCVSRIVLGPSQVPPQTLLGPLPPPTTEEMIEAGKRLGEAVAKAIEPREKVNQVRDLLEPLGR